MFNRHLYQLKDSKAYIKGHLRNLKELILNCNILCERREAIQEETIAAKLFKRNDRREDSEQRKLKKTILRRNRTRSRNYQDEGSHEPSGIQEP